MRVRWSRRRLSGRSAGSWHALPERTLSRAGRHCGAALTEAPAVAGRPVFVVGGGNSAGQAALHLAKYARQVTLLVRGPSLVDSMSDYLIEQIRGAHNVDIVDRVAVVGGTAVDDSLAEIEISHLDEGSTEVVPAAVLFLFIGSTPLEGTVQRDEAGYVLVGADATELLW